MVQHSYINRITKVKKNATYSLAAVLLIMIGSYASGLTFLSIAICSLLFAYLNCGKINPKYIPRLVIILLLFQNLGIGIGAHLGNNTSSSLSFMTQIPTLMILISYLFCLFRSNLTKLDGLYFILIGICTIFMFVGNGGLSAKITYYRNFLIFYMAFVIGKKSLTNKKDIDEFLTFFLYISVFAVIFGFLGWIIGKPFYQMTGVLEVYSAKQYSAYRNGLPGNFQTIFGGTWVNRFASLYYDPVNFSYFMTLSTLIAFIQRKWKLFIIFGVCEFLTFGKGGFLILGLTLICIRAQSLFKKTNKRIIRRIIILGAVCGVAGLVYLIQTRFANDFGTFNHFYGMLTGLEAVKNNPMGNGLGTAGNLIKTAQLNSQEISETGLLNMAYQIGVLGATIFCALFLSTASGAFRIYRRTNHRLCLLCTYLPLVLLIVSVYQENTYTPQCVVPYMILIGAASQYQNKMGELA